MKRFYQRFKVWYYDLSIFKKLNYMNALVIVLPITLLAFFANQISSQIIINKTKDNFTQNLILITQSLNIELENAEKMTNIIIVNDNVQNITSNIKNMDSESITIKGQIISTFMDNIIERRDQISSCVISGDNNLIITSRTIEPAKVNIKFSSTLFNKDRFLYRNLTEKWTDLHEINYEEYKNETPCISLNKKIIEPLSGKVTGEVTLNINEDILAKSYSELKYEKTGRFFIINRLGEIVSSNNKNELFQNISNEKYVHSLDNNYMNNNIFNIKGTKYLIISSKYVPMDWIIVGIVPLSEVTDANTKVTFIIYLTGALCMIIAIVCSIFVSKSISNPIIKLSKSMEEVGLGNFDISLKPIGNDEIGILLNGFNKMTTQISDLMNQVYIEQKKKKEFELSALQSQINPHFLYNTLESVCSLIQMDMNEESFKMVKSLSIFYRVALSKGKNIINIREEIQNVESYLIIMKIRYGEKFEYIIDINEAILNNKIIKLSIQPIVENAIYHGIKSKQGKGLINIIGYIEEKNVFISIIDDGIGIKSEDIENIFTSYDENDVKKRSFGIKSVDERIKLYFGQDFGIKIYSTQGEGTKVIIKLPNTIKEL